jgi:hypothetical protein
MQKSAKDGGKAQKKIEEMGGEKRCGGVCCLWKRWE